METPPPSQIPEKAINAISFFFRGFSIISGVFIGLVFLCIGLIFVFEAIPEQNAIVRNLESLPQVDSAGFITLPVGTEAMITGTLIDNPELNPQHLVAYASQIWVVEYDSEDGYEGEWDTLETTFPLLYIQTPTGILLAAPSMGLGVQGDTHDTIVHRTNSSISASGVPEGSIRVSGYMNGDTLTITGTRSAYNQIVPTRYYGGTGSSMIGMYRTGSILFTLCGIGLLVAAPVIIFLAVTGRMRGRGSVSIK